jgi:hypothetical protein
MEENNNNSIWKMALAAFGISYLAKKIEKSLENTYTPTIPTPKPIKDTSPFGIIKTTQNYFIVTGEPIKFKCLQNPHYPPGFEGRHVSIPKHDCVPYDYAMKYTEAIIRKQYSLDVERKLLNRFVMCELFMAEQPLDKSLLYASTVLRDTRIYEVGPADHIRILTVANIKVNFLIKNVPFDYLVDYMEELSKREPAENEIWYLPDFIVNKYKGIVDV